VLGGTVEEWSISDRPDPTGATGGVRFSDRDATKHERGRSMGLLRSLLGGVLRQQRLRQGRTLRDVSAAAQVSLGYISEVERGQKEASSELLAAICSALEVPLSDVLREVSDQMAFEEAALAAELSEVARADLTPADLARTDLAPADLAHADLTPADLAHADLARTDLAPADLAHADLTPAEDLDRVVAAA
jgi:transcriptional regulator with XRE-family HTH domain